MLVAQRWSLRSPELRVPGGEAGREEGSFSFPSTGDAKARMTWSSVEHLPRSPEVTPVTEWKAAGVGKARDGNPSQGPIPVKREAVLDCDSPRSGEAGPDLRAG